MTKKKLLIYSATFAAFMLLFGVYVLTALRSTDQSNAQRLQANLSISTTQMQRNLEYRAKDLRFAFERLSAREDPALWPDALERLGDAGARFYLCGNDGVMSHPGQPFDARKIELQALDTAGTQGFAAVQLSDPTGPLPQVALFVLVSEKTQTYLIEVIPVAEYLATLTDNLPTPPERLFLFDEWGGPILARHTATTPEEEQVHTSLQEQATAYSLAPEKPIMQQGITQKYNTYLPVNQPKGWFLGARVDYAQQNLIFSALPVSSIIFFLLLLLIIAVVIMLDIVNDREKKKELFLVSNIDHLTGLVNNAGMQESMNAFMEKYPVTGLSLVCMDLIAFSRINGMFGYAVGDLLLRTVADVIRDRQFCGVRSSADCFVFLTKTQDHMVEIMETSFFDEIEKQLGHEYVQMVGFKFGIYPIGEGRTSFREVYEGALLALKDAKKQSKQSEVIYDSHLKNTMELQKNIEINMMHALSKEEFLVYIQPQFQMPQEECTRGELLIRWHSEFMGFLPPDQFIPVFEGNGFVVETDFFMLASAMELLEKRMLSGEPMLTLAVNQSKVTITFPNYYERLKALVARYQVPLRYIELEITESTLENDWGTLVPLIYSIKKLGFSVAMDDFGSGFSSLNTLRILPIDILKIDKGFLQESDTSDRSKTIIRNIVNMAKELSIEVICEGVETEDQLNFLKAAGCDIIQGFYYSKPLPLEEFVEKYM